MCVCVLEWEELIRAYIMVVLRESGAPLRRRSPHLPRTAAHGRGDEIRCFIDAQRVFVAVCR